MRRLTPRGPHPQPFPLNPTFNPLPPLADVTKTRIYNAYLHNILQKDATDSQVVRAVSTKFGVAMDRVRAIVRLKELERRFKSEVRSRLSRTRRPVREYQPLADKRISFLAHRAARCRPNS